MPYTLDHNERIALSTAMSFVLSYYDTDTAPEIVMEDIFAGGNSNAIVWLPFEHLSNVDVYNIIWSLQESIYEAMCASDFSLGIRSEFTKKKKENK